MKAARILVLVMLASGCDLYPFGGACASIVYRAIEVDVVDRTGRWAAGNATGVIRDGAFVDSLRPVQWRGTAPNDTATTLGAGLGRAGTYAITVVRPGYRTWHQTGVRARTNACGVQTTRVRATLDAL